MSTSIDKGTTYDFRTNSSDTMRRKEVPCDNESSKDIYTK
jgi:hypothetical protein